MDELLDNWMDQGPTVAPSRIADATRAEIRITHQRRATRWPPAWRFPAMNSNILRFAAAAAVVLAVILGMRFIGPNIGAPGPTATPSPTASPMPLPPPDSSLEAGTYRVTPFADAGAAGVCEGQAGCTESPADDSIGFTVTVPDGWSISALGGIWVDSNAPPDGAMLIFFRGGWLYEDPCNASGSPSMEVGPTADDFATAIADHPLFDATEPVDVTLGGYAGQYVDIRAPSDLEQCVGEYRLWDPGIYAQGPEHRWHLWILDVDGTRVVVQTMDYPGTPADRRAELQAMLDSLEITP